MPTAIYRGDFGERLASVTGICSVDAGGLIAWGYKRGLQGLPLRATEDDAAAAGEFAHLLVEAAIKNRTLTEADFPTNGAAELGMRAFANYQRWQELTKIKWTDSELALVLPRTSAERFGIPQFGGTIDLIGIEEGRNTYSLGDIKTGSIYPEHLLQVAAYARLFEECTGHHISSLHLLRFNREAGDFSHHYFDELEEDWQAFVHQCHVYEWRVKAKKRLK